MHLPALSTNIAIIVAIAAAGGYGLLAGRHRLRGLILSIYVGIVLASQLTLAVSPYVKPLNSWQTAWLLLVLPILLFGFVRPQRQHSGKGPAVLNVIVGLLAGALIASSALALLPVKERIAAEGDSYLAILLRMYHLWLVGLLPVIAIAVGFIKDGKRKHS
jgi:hydrogenase-4 membrane subunit HyfE